MKRDWLKILTILTSITLITTYCNNPTSLSKAEYSGADITDIASISVDKMTKKPTFSISNDGKWKIYAGKSTNTIDFTHPLAEGSKAGIYPLPINDSSRHYYQLVTPEGKAILAERHLPMKGGYNFRDLGGIKTREGKYVQWGKVFRADDLNKLTDADLSYLSSIPLISIVDFRAETEVSKAPDLNPKSLKKNYNLYITPGNLLTMESAPNLSEEDMIKLMQEMNEMLVTDSTCIREYKTFFELLQNEQDVPLLFHCSAGKDRTGMGAALFLSALGVDENAILEDYVSSNYYLNDKYANIIAKHPNLKILLEVRPQFLKAGLEMIKSKYGSVDSYLSNTLGVDLDKMKKLYLY